MLSRRSVLLTLAIATLSAATVPVLAGSRGTNPVQMFDTDSDGTLDLAEVKKAASAVFAKLDRDHDGTLDKLRIGREIECQAVGRGRS